MVASEGFENFDLFRDCLSTAVIARLCPAASKSPKKRKVKGRKNDGNILGRASFDDDGQNAEIDDLSDFVQVLQPNLSLTPYVLKSTVSGG